MFQNNDYNIFKDEKCGKNKSLKKLIFFKIKLIKTKFFRAIKNCVK